MYVAEIGKTIIAPAHWSYNAVRIFADKYLAKRDANSILLAIKRVADGVACGDEEMSEYVEKAILDQRFAYNSPVFFNLGVEPLPQCSACFIQSVEDNMDSIMQLGAKEAALFKYGSGTGTNLSNIRGSREGLSGGGIASGPVSFMKVFDRIASVVKSGGKTRRAAKMQILDIDHPDIVEFIDCKVSEERKARDLITKAGYEASFDGEAYSSVHFQNANLSVRVSDEYMKAVKTNGTHALKARTTGEIMQTVDAAELFRRIAISAHECGDPGIQFDDTINKWHTCPSGGRINSSNPCSEFMFLDETSCNLASLNLMAYLRASGDFDIELFQADVRVLVRTMDRLVSLSGYPTEDIAIKTRTYRPLGIGFTNLGTFLAASKLRYDTPEARSLASSITALMHFTAYDESAILAKSIGPYDGYDIQQHEILKMHTEYLALEDGGVIWEAARSAAQTALFRGQMYGYRNSQLTVLAPTGTISFIMDCNTTGIEPIFARNTTKKMVDGTTVDMVYSNPYIVTASEVSPMDHVFMMSVCQPFLSGAISKTINMPPEATVEEIEQIYMEAHRLGVKSLAVYRDGSKLLQPMNDNDKGIPATESQSCTSTRQPLPGTRDAVTHKFSVAGHDGYLTVGKYLDGRPGEVFIQISKEGSTISGLLDSWAITTSIALQYGVPLSAIVDKLTYMRFEPSGMTGNPSIPIAHSIIDYVCRWLILEQSADEEVEEVQTHGNACPDCGQMMQRTGTCFSCSTCGFNGGCG